MTGEHNKVSKNGKQVTKVKNQNHGTESPGKVKMGPNISTYPEHQEKVM